jgi:hypothetical protein
VLGLLVALADTHQVKSNRESGYGRYDLMLIPKDTNKLGIIIEFKKTSAREKETLDMAADRAMEQIKAKGYAQELRQLGIKNVVAYAIAVQGKQILLKAQEL